MRDEEKKKHERGHVCTAEIPKNPSTSTLPERPTCGCAARSSTRARMSLVRSPLSGAGVRIGRLPPSREGAAGGRHGR